MTLVEETVVPTRYLPTLPGPGTLRDAVPHVLALLEVEHHLQPHDGTGQRGAPDGRRAPRHVRVEGVAAAVHSARHVLEVAERW